MRSRIKGHKSAAYQPKLCDGATAWKAAVWGTGHLIGRTELISFAGCAMLSSATLPREKKRGSSKKARG